MVVGDARTLGQRERVGHASNDVSPTHVTTRTHQVRSQQCGVGASKEVERRHRRHQNSWWCLLKDFDGRKVLGCLLDPKKTGR